MVGSLARDVRYAARTLVKRPAVPLIVVMTLALGSAGVTAIFALVNAIVIRPLPYAAAERLLAVKHSAPGLGLPEAGLSSRWLGPGIYVRRGRGGRAGFQRNSIRETVCSGRGRAPGVDEDYRRWAGAPHPEHPRGRAGRADADAPGRVRTDGSELLATDTGESGVHSSPSKALEPIIHRG